MGRGVIAKRQESDRNETGWPVVRGVTGGERLGWLWELGSNRWERRWVDFVMVRQLSEVLVGYRGPRVMCGRAEKE